MLNAFEINFTNKPCACVFDQQGNYDYYSIKLVQRRLFVLKEYGVVCHINKGFGGKRFKGKKITWYYDMGKDVGVGSPFDPQKPFNPMALEKLKGQHAFRLKKRMLAQSVFQRTKEIEIEKEDGKKQKEIVKDETSLAPEYEQTNPDNQLEEPRPFTRKEAENLRKKLASFNDVKEAMQFLEDNGIQVMDNQPMDADFYEDDGGFDDEEVIYNYGETLLNVEKQSRDMSSKPIKPTLKMAMILPIVFAVLIILVASPIAINNLGSIKLPVSGMFGGFIMPLMKGILSLPF